METGARALYTEAEVFKRISADASDTVQLMFVSLPYMHTRDENAVQQKLIERDSFSPVTVETDDVRRLRLSNCQSTQSTNQSMYQSR